MAISSVAVRPPHPWPEAGPGGVASSLFCFERDLPGLSHPFQKAKLLPFWQALPLGLSETIDTFLAFKCALVSMLLKITPMVLTGPVGLAQIVGELAKSRLHALLQFTAFISVNLAIINLFPLPALDGGRITFLVLEWVRRGRRLSAKAEGLIHGIGFALRLIFAAILTYQDVLRILHGASPVK
jgi:regulator of sigma E protease